MASPFKFLDPYDVQDKEAFFGREAETRQLYSLVTKNRLTFVYGPSGSGKTSLVQCGLGNRFSGIDWLPLFIRRGENINQSLREALAGALQQKETWTKPHSDALETLFNRYLRPVYLIFDQFEELFIIGGHGASQEHQQFYNTIAELLEVELPFRIVFIMREDYFGHLNEFERVVPELYHHKLRVEPMSRDNLHRVIEGSCKVFDIPFGNPEQDPGRILDNILMGRTAVQMPFVQVYLHMLYELAQKRKATDKNYSGQPILFDQEVIEQLGPIEDVLGLFVEVQEQAILKELKASGLAPPEDLVRQVLDVFVSDEGTKAPVAYHSDAGGALFLEGNAAGPLALLNPGLASACLLALEKSRILRRTDNKLEIAHDTLAAQIHRQRSDELRQIREIRRRIEIGYQEHLDSDGNYYFSRGQLSRIEPYLEKIALLPEWKSFLEESRRDIEARENAERVRVQRELELAEKKLEAERSAQAARKKELQATEEKLAVEQKAKKRQRAFSIVLGLVAVVAIILGSAARQAAFQSRMSLGETLKSQGNYQAAVKQLALAKRYAFSPGERSQLDNLIDVWRELEMLVHQGDSLLTEANLLGAINKYEQALQIDESDYLVNSKYQDALKQKNQHIEELKKAIRGQLAYEGCRFAKAYIQEGLKLAPDDPELQAFANRCQE